MAQTNFIISKNKLKLLVSDRILIIFMLCEGYTQTKIAKKELGVNRSIASWEIGRGSVLQIIQADPFTDIPLGLLRPKQIPEG